MGYYVTAENSTMKVRKEFLEDSYKALCDLNESPEHDYKKRGGSYSGGVQTAKWFSWMDENYPETCKTTAAILNQLGFETSYDNEGNLCLDFYDSKTGQEEVFIEALAPYAEGEIEWVGEDGRHWKDVIKDGKYSQLIGKVIYE